MPDHTVYVGRGSRWGNPFTGHANRDAAAMFHEWLSGSPNYDDTYRINRQTYDRRWVREHLSRLTGRPLACWCSLDQPCHADVLIALANPKKAVRL